MDTIRVLQERLNDPQGLTFDDDGCLWCAEPMGKGLFCRAQDGQTTRINTGGEPNSVVYADGYVWFSDRTRNGLYKMHVQTRATEPVLTEVAGGPLSAPGNLTIDERGNLLFTCPGPIAGNQTGWVAARRPDGYAEVLTDGLAHPDGLAFLPGCLLITERDRQRIWIGFWDARNLSWETIRVWATVVEAETTIPQTAGPGGMAVGPDGDVYVAVYGLGLIRVFSTDGQPVRDIELPGNYPTDCAFNPSGTLGLVVSETERG